MNNPRLAELNDDTARLVQALGNRLALAAEDERSFALEFGLPPAELPALAARLLASLDLAGVSLNYAIQDITGKARLEAGGSLRLDECRAVGGVTPNPLEPEEKQVEFEALAGRLGQAGARIPVEEFSAQVDSLAQAGALVDVRLSLSINKPQVLKDRLGAAPDSEGGRRLLLFISADQFAGWLEGQRYTDLQDFFSPHGETETVVLLGNASGKDSGPSLQVLGLDAWIASASFLADDNAALARRQSERSLSQEAVQFRKEECTWEISQTELTPRHFFIASSGLSSERVTGVLDTLCVQACLTYLANRSTPDGGGYQCEFSGYRRARVAAPAALASPTPVAGLYSLFHWAYQNSQSDKLGIVRQILSLRLGSDPQSNLQPLLAEAGDVKIAAEKNFEYYLRKNVEAYFDRRQKVVENLQKLGEEIGQEVSKLAGDLIGDLYKTVGVILGVVLAAIVNPNLTLPVVRWTSLLYAIYILFITFYSLPSIFFRYDAAVRAYEHNLEGLKSILSKNEIREIEGSATRRALWFFRVYFGLTNLAYGLLAGLAIFLFTIV